MEPIHPPQPAKSFPIRLLVFLAFLFAWSASASILYVDLNSPNPTPPYNDWSTAATNIQDAINAALAGETVLVTNGTYAVGGKVMAGDLTNRVALNKAITVQSVNGPWVTTIQGAGATNGTAAVRCAWLTNGAALVGFTLTGGATRTAGSTVDLRSGGGVWCASTNATVSNCIIISNTASSFGGGIFQGTLNNSLVRSNAVSPLTVGIAYNANLLNSTVVSNAGFAIAGAASRLTNCIVYFNPQNYSGASFAYSCTTPLPAGEGNFTNDPGFFLDGVHLASTSACRFAGTNFVSGTDLFGQAWASPPSVGCAQWQPAPWIAIQPKVQLTNNPTGFRISTVVSGQEPLTYFWIHAGAVIEDDGHFSSAHTTNLLARGIRDSDSGGYQVVVSNAVGVVTSELAQVSIHFVDAAGLKPLPPYLDWVTAATNIQDAIDAAAAGEIVLVTNGVYGSGGKVMAGDLTNRVALDKAVMVSSVNGYAATIIQGAAGGLITNGPLAIRCAWVTNGALLSGFTLRHGATRTGGLMTTVNGGGLSGLGASGNGLVANCMIRSNSAVYGGGVAYCSVVNSIIVANTAALDGGGADHANLNNCTVASNFSGSDGSGVFYGQIRNSIVTGNFTSYGLLNFGPGAIGADFAYCCTYPLPAGPGNISTTPQFLDTAYHLPAVSPCRGVGNSLYASGKDNDGEPWASPPSIGCDEVVDANLVGPLSVTLLMLNDGYVPPQSILINRFAFFRGLITGRATRVDWNFGDGTKVTNGSGYPSHVWTNAGDYTVTFTAYNFDNPGGVSTNQLIHILPLARPVLESATVTNNAFQFSFSAQGEADYIIQYATNLLPPVTWQTLTSIYFSPGGMTPITDANTNSARFYRVLVK